MAPPDWDSLEAAIDGDVLLPQEDGYEELTRPFNGRFAQCRPQAVARCTSAGDVAETLRFIAQNRLATAIRSGGHSFADHSTTRGVVIDVGRLDAIAVVNGQVQVGAGALLGDVYATLEHDGLTIAGGTCPTVGVAGLTLGGGLGILGRSYGLTSDRLIQATVVLADGQTVTCDSEHDHELHWALQGAGASNFGVVTALAFDPISAPRDAVNMHARWAIHHAGPVIDAWQHWAPTAPDELAASVKVAVPGELDRPPSVDVYATFFGDEVQADELLQQLTVNAQVEPLDVVVHRADYRASRQFWATLDAQEAESAHVAITNETHELLYVKSEFFRQPLAVEVIGRLLDTLLDDRQIEQSRELDFMPWGGAYARRRPDETAFVHRDPRFLLKQSLAIPSDAPPYSRIAAERRINAIWEATRPAASGSSFQNFADPDLTRWAAAYYGENLERLTRVKARYDPQDIFRRAQSLPLP